VRPFHRSGVGHRSDDGCTPTGWWHNFPKYAVSLLKAWCGDDARPENEFGFGWVPRIVGDHSQLPMTLAMRDGVIRGKFMLGQKPAVGGTWFVFHIGRRLKQLYAGCTDPKDAGLGALTGIT
jgi:hypothetical protein